MVLDQATQPIRGKKYILPSLFFFLILSMPMSTNADIYFWVDADGVKHFGNTLPPDINTKIKRTYEVESKAPKSSYEPPPKTSYSHTTYKPRTSEQIKPKKSDWHINLCRTNLKDGARRFKQFALETASEKGPKKKFSNILNEISIACSESSSTDLDAIHSALRNFYDVKELVNRVRECRKFTGNVWRDSYSPSCINELIRNAKQLKAQGESLLAAHSSKDDQYEEIKKRTEIDRKYAEEVVRAREAAAEEEEFRKREEDARDARAIADAARRDADWAEKKAKNGVWGVPQFILERKAEYSNERADRAEKEAEDADSKTKFGW